MRFFGCSLVLAGVFPSFLDNFLVSSVLCAPVTKTGDERDQQDDESILAQEKKCIIGTWLSGVLSAYKWSRPSISGSDCRQQNFVPEGKD